MVNFTLSKDFHELVRFRIHALKGITTSILYEKIYCENKSDYETKADGISIKNDPADILNMTKCTNVLIEQKLKDYLTETDIITEIQIESGVGKKLTVPVVIRLSGELEREACIFHENENGNSSYIDDTFIKFTPSISSYGKIKPISIAASSSFLTNSSHSSSSSYINKMSSQFKDTHDWIELPIEYSKLPIEASMVFTNWCYDVRSGKRVLLCTGRMNMFNDKCTLNTGRATVSLNIPGHNPNLDLSRSSDFDNINLSTEAFMEKIENNSNRPAWLDKMTKAKLNEMAKSKSFSSQFNESKAEIVVEFEYFEIPIVFSDIKYVPISLHKYDASNSVLNYDPSFNQITYTNTPNGLNDDNSSVIYLSSSTPFDPDQIRGEQMEDPIEQKFRRLERMQHLSSLDNELKPTLRMREALSKVMKKQFFEKMTAKERNMVWRYRWFILNTLITGNTHGWNNAFINFIKCVDWNNTSETKEFESILESLKQNMNLKSDNVIEKSYESPIDIFVEKLQIIDCLEILSSNYKNQIVRNMAVSRLKYVSDSELSIFMVQLVQSIKNETLLTENIESEQNKDNYDSGRTLSVNNADLVHIDEEENELQPPSSAKSGNSSRHTISLSDYQIVDNEFNENKFDASIVSFIDDLIFNPKKMKNVPTPNIPSKFIDFLINRVIKNFSLTNYFYWCLKVEVEEEKLRNKNDISQNVHLENNANNNINNNNNSNGKIIYNNGENNSFDRAGENNLLETYKLLHGNIHEITMKKFILKLLKSTHGRAKLYELRRQIELVNKLHEFCYKIKVEHRKETTPMKVEILKNMLIEKHKRTIFGSKSESRNILVDENRHESMVEFPKLAMPLDPSVIVNGTIPAESSVFKSSLNPLKITFKTPNGEKYPVMYKIGDDLRQDQFVIQVITLMEKILESENMDLKLKPYKILATGSVEGFIQFIPNNSLSHILSKYNNSILLYLQTFNPDPTAHLGVNTQVMDNYVRSCAGYCVVTYILGVGDRHLENLLLSKDGHFFHADFGYILGQDPKPFPPLMKLPIQIIEGMGGYTDVNYKKFCQYCFITYITLRKNASLILNLVQLMINTSIPALRTGIENNEAEKMELLWKVEEKFMLEMNDEDAVLHFQNLIDSSVNAVLPVVIDRLHNLAQYWRS